jgi:hypothetical protein
MSEDKMTRDEAWRIMKKYAPKMMLDKKRDLIMVDFRQGEPGKASAEALKVEDASQLLFRGGTGYNFIERLARFPVIDIDPNHIKHDGRGATLKELAEHGIVITKEYIPQLPKKTAAPVAQEPVDPRSRQAALFVLKQYAPNIRIDRKSGQVWINVGVTYIRPDQGIIERLTQGPADIELIDRSNEVARVKAALVALGDKLPWQSENEEGQFVIAGIKTATSQGIDLTELADNGVNFPGSANYKSKGK